MEKGEEICKNATHCQHCKNRERSPMRRDVISDLVKQFQETRVRSPPNSRSPSPLDIKRFSPLL